MRRHQPRPTADDPHPVVERQRAGDDGRGDLAQRVADDRAGHARRRTHRGGERDLHGEQRRLHPVDAGHRLRRRHRLGDREPGLAGDQRLDLRDRRGERRFGRQQAGAHRRPLRALAGEHPHRAAVVLPDGGLVRRVAVGDLAQAGASSSRLSAMHDRAHRPVRTPARQGVGQIRQRRQCHRRGSPTQSASRPAVRRSSSADVADNGKSSGASRRACSLRRRCVPACSAGACSTWRARWCPTVRTTTPPRAADGDRWWATACSPAARRVSSRSGRARRAAG